MDVKSFFQIWCFNLGKTPDYDVRIVGPKNSKFRRYLCEAKVDGYQYTGYGNSTNEELAKFNAAKDFVQYLVRREVIKASDVPQDVSQTDITVNWNGTLKVQKISSNPPMPKNALCILNEMCNGLVFEVISQEGPAHAPVFTVSVEINGKIFVGKGRSKKIAKHNVAETALRSLMQFKNPNENGVDLFPIDCDDLLIKKVSSLDASEARCTAPVTNSDRLLNGLLYREPASLNLKPEPLEDNPIMLLNRLYPGAQYQVVSESEDQYNRFTVITDINGKRFLGTGPNKKLAKAAAARSALAVLYNLSFSIATSSQKPVPDIIGESPGISQQFADHISRLVIEKFTSLMEDNPTYARRKVLAGIVISKDYDLDSCRVLTVSTGTKCINGERLSVSGSVLNDSHAEIVSRRCLNKFFYSELEKYIDLETKTDSIFEQSDRNGLRVKDEFKFHLFINTAPCGDSRIFSPHDEYSADKHPYRKARGQLRTKIESGEGTIPVKSSEGIQTYDGVLQGERLLTMSCSDKIAKWNVVGLQGALLSNFIEPVYLDSIILGSLFHPEHLYRALYGRIENTVDDLPPPYRLNKPKMTIISSKEFRQPSKAPNFSVNWTTGDSDPEIVNAVTGRTEQNQISRLAKCRFFMKFLSLVGRIPSITALELNESPRMYSECKEVAADYQVAKRQLYSAFKKADLGNWVKKPIETDQFEW